MNKELLGNIASAALLILFIVSILLICVFHPAVVATGTEYTPPKEFYQIFIEYIKYF